MTRCASGGPGSAPAACPGWPTGPGRSPAEQATALREMVTALHRHRGNYGVTDYRWFALRDADSASPSFQQQYGVLRDDWSPKPAFAVLRELTAKLGAPRHRATR